jgi:hypothetical protein
MRLTQAGAVPVTSFSFSGECTVDHRSALGPLDQRLMREHVPPMALGTAVYVGAPAPAQSDDPAAAAVLRRWQRIRRRRPAGEPVRAGGASQRQWVTAACSDGTWAAGGSECRSRRSGRSWWTARMRAAAVRASCRRDRPDRRPPAGLPAVPRSPARAVTPVRLARGGRSRPSPSSRPARGGPEGQLGHVAIRCHGGQDHPRSPLELRRRAEPTALTLVVTSAPRRAIRPRAATSCPKPAPQGGRAPRARRGGTTDGGPRAPRWASR